MNVRFDESLGKFVDIIDKEVGSSAAESAIYLRDATGILSAVLDQTMPQDTLDGLTKNIAAALGHYARPDGAVRDSASSGAQKLLAEAKSLPRTRVGERSVHFLDRRLVGADWLLSPEAATGIPRIAFASLKGGVGRSTALAVVAAYLSRRGLRVLAVDLDLEAPGIGTMLVSPEALPRYGVLDYLIENGISGIDEDFMTDMKGDSFLGLEGGKVTVLPAIGTATLQNPAGALAKIARAYLEDVQPDGTTTSLTAQIREMIDRFLGRGDFDVVLVDGRAGLHETTAAALLGLGAEILFFGIDEPQTYSGYSLLFAHIAQFEGEPYEDWRERVHFVEAKADASLQIQQQAEARFTELYNSILARRPFKQPPPEGDESGELTADDFDLTWDDEAPSDLVDSVVGDPVTILHIADDARYRGFNPLADGSLLTPTLYETTFGSLLEWVDANVTPLNVDDED